MRSVEDRRLIPRLGQGGESNACPLHFPFIHTFYDRAYFVDSRRSAVNRPRLQWPKSCYQFWVNHTRQLKLLTYNVHSGIGTDKRYDLDRIEQVLREERPD